MVTVATKRFQLGLFSRRNLRGVHPDLIACCHMAISISTQDFVVWEGLRSLSRQRKLFEQGRSKTLKSRHLTGHAIDLVPWVNNRPVWNTKLCVSISKAMLESARILKVGLEWGADWDSDGDTQDEEWTDYPHFQLSRKRYKDSMIEHSEEARLYLISHRLAA